MIDKLGPVDENEPKEKWDGDRWLCEGCDWLKYNPTEKIRDCRHCVFAAGLAEGIRRCREAVEKIAESHPDINVNASNGWVKLSVILAAIDAVEGE
jgi:hypothetical protein